MGILLFCLLYIAIIFLISEKKLIANEFSY